MKRWQAIGAMVASFWIAPFGLGYLFLKQWGRFVLALFLVTIGQSLLAQIIGRQSAAAVMLGVWILTLVDTFRIALPAARAKP